MALFLYVSSESQVRGDDVTFDLTELAGDGLDVLASAEIGDLRRLHALHQAAECDFGAVNEDGENAFMLAANNGHMHVLGWMSEVGIADYTSRDGLQWSLLHARVTWRLSSG